MSLAYSFEYLSGSVSGDARFGCISPNMRHKSKAIIAFKISPNSEMKSIKNRTFVLPRANCTCCFTACLSYGLVEFVLMLQLISAPKENGITLSPGQSVV